MRLNPQQRQIAANEINAKLDKVTLSWNNDLKEWHPIALKALKFASAAALEVPQNKYRTLTETNTHGVGANIVSVLANNLETRTPEQMGYSVEEWADVLELNQRIADHWEGLCAPIRAEVFKQFEEKED